MIKRRNLAVFVMAVLLISCGRPVTFQVVEQKCNNSENPIGVESKSPVFGWIIQAEENGFQQSAYQILVADDPALLKRGNGNIWDSGKVNSKESIRVFYKGEEPEPGKSYYWQVKIWDQHDRESPWSDIASWQMGLMNEADWAGAKWIAYEELAENMRIVPGVHGGGGHLGEKGVKRAVVPLFRKEFEVSQNIHSATLFISGLGHYEASINGMDVADVFLAPGWTDYDKTVFYNSYDVTHLLQAGSNAMGVIVGPGFYNINRERYRKLVIACGYPKMISQLRINYKDGSTEVIVSDDGWRTSPSPITYSSIYGGEAYDANLEQPGWNQPGFDDSAWDEVVLPESPQGKLMAEFDYPVRVMDTFYPVETHQLDDGSYTFDFGQNASGIIEIELSGKKGQEVHIWPSEIINEDKSRNQRATGRPHYYTYTLKEDGVEIWRPRFTYYGLRYAQVEGAIPGSFEGASDLPRIENIRMLHTRNSSPANGSFNSSNELFNDTYRLIDWAIRSNYQSVLTDCPHREKLGWMEQTFLMGQGVHFNYDNYHLYRKLIYGMMDGQTEEGMIPTITPEYPLFEGDFLSVFRDSPEWGSAAIVLPYLLYKWYGDKDILQEAWPMMVSYARYLQSRSEGHIVNYGLGDWYDLGPEKPGFSQLTVEGLTATAIYYYDVKLLAEIAEILRRGIEVHRYNDWAEEIRVAFNERFFDPETSVYATGSQTSMAMPLYLNMVDEENHDAVFNNFVDSIVANDKALTAGDVGFHYVVGALMEGGQSQLLYEMNNRDDVPGYGYQLKKGATALTESWMALESVSNNHLMLGHIMEWLFAGLGGISQADGSAAYDTIVLKPEVVGELNFVEVHFNTPYGRLKSDWLLEEDDWFSYSIEIPANSSAVVYLPQGADVASLLINGLPVESGFPHVHFLGLTDGRAVFETGSGSYHFNTRMLY